MLFQCPLSELPDKFEMFTKKGLFAYSRYTAKKYNHEQGTDTLEEAMKSGDIDEKDRKIFIKLLHDADKSNKGTIVRRHDNGDITYDMYKFALYYCGLDIEILFRAIFIFRN